MKAVVPEALSEGELLLAPATAAALRDEILATVGERGFAQTTMRELAERTGLSEGELRHRFASMEACFAWAYEEGAERFYGRVLEACQAAASWRHGFEAALASFLGLVAARPAEAKALLVEVRVAGGDAWRKHQELVERLVDLLDDARHEPGARASSTPTTAGFVLGAIEESLAIELAAGRGADVARLLPDLTRLAFLQLFGDEG